MKHTKKRFKDKTHLLLRKGVYPYDYMDSPERMKETQLPPAEDFHSILNDSDISPDDYTHAKNVWKAFGMKTMQDYHDLYLESDVLLLTDVFENFRDVCQKNYGLDPAWYYTAPGLSWDAMLKETKVKIELLTDADMLLMFEKGIRGGVSMISHRHAKANNRYMKNWNPSLPSTYIQYLDANNLYGWAMSQEMPVGGFAWVSDGDLDDIINTKDPGVGHILEVDLEYPTHLHNLHNGYPLAPEVVKINKVEKLVPNLYDKTKYVLHRENLTQCLSLGMKLTKIHRAIRFDQRRWLAPYIKLNTDLRTEATTGFEKDFFKLMNNSVFGKTMENIRKRVNIHLVTTPEKAVKLMSKPNFKKRTIFSDSLVAVHMGKTKLKFNKPVFIGMSVLEVSKTLMYDFHYNYIKKKYGEKATILMTDTDSLVYKINTKDFYKDINNDVDSKFDTSAYDPSHPSGIKTGVNKKVIGMMKDECGGKVMTEFVGLRAKLYATKMDDQKEDKKCKGIKKAVVKNKISFSDYKRCLYTEKEQTRKVNTISSHKHVIHTSEIRKVALSSADDKRNILKNGVSTLSYGHFLI